MAGLGSIYAGIGLAQGLGGIPQAYTMGRRAAEESAMAALQRKTQMENLETAKLSREKTIAQMKQEEQDRQDALRRAGMTAQNIQSYFPVSQTPVTKLPPTAMGATTPTTAKAPTDVPTAAMGISTQETPVVTPTEPTSQFSALGVEPEVQQYKLLQKTLGNLKSKIEDPNATQEEKNAALRDINYYAPQIPKVIEGYKNWGYEKIARFASSPSVESLSKIEPIIKELHPEVGNIAIEKVPAIGDDGKPIKGKFTNRLLASIKDESGNSILVPLDARLLTTMGDPKKIEDVLSKIESARQQSINAFAVSEREMRRLAQMGDNTARQINDKLLSMAPTWRIVNDSKGKFAGYEPIPAQYDDLLEKKIDELRPRYSSLPKNQQRAAIEKDPDYLKFESTIIKNPVFNR
jgi:hypothetical protein